MTSVGSPSFELLIKDEIVSLATVLADTQARLHQLAARIEHVENNNWKKRIEELTDSQKEAVNSANWLRVQNLELERRLQEQIPEVNNAVQARNDAFRKLKHARKVIRDLLTEREDMSSPRVIGTKFSQEEINETLDESFHDSSSSSSYSSESDKTVRLHCTTPATPTEDRNSGGSVASSLRGGAVVSSSRTSNISSSQTARSKSVYLSPQTVSRSGFVASSTQGRSSHLSPPSTRISPELWNIHYKNPPGVSIIQAGPITWDRLISSVNFDDDTANSLRCLASSRDTGMRLAITHYQHKTTVACVYDPFLVELPGQSFILDWGGPKENKNLENYIINKKESDATFHTFLFPTSENNWFYVGGLEWSSDHVQENLWPTFGEADRKKILKKLVRRTRGEINETEMAKRLDNGQLQQFCVELTAVKDARISQDFAAEVLGRQASPR